MIEAFQSAAMALLLAVNVGSVASMAHAAVDEHRIVLTSPLATQQVGEAYSSIVCRQGIAKNGSIVAKSYAKIVVTGAMDGEIHFDDYTRVVIDGDASGLLDGHSYIDVRINGNFSGRLKAHTYSTVRIQQAFTGVADLHQSTLILDGRVTRAQLAQIHGSGRLFIHESDLPSGDTEIGDLHLTVGHNPE